MPATYSTYRIDAIVKNYLVATAIVFASGYAVVLVSETAAAMRAVQPEPSSQAAAGTVPFTPAQNQSEGASASYNWAGYAAAGTFSGVSGGWTVPTVQPSNNTASEATWIGIGGMVSTDLLQVGTQSTTQDNAVVYRAWYEALPKAMEYAPLGIHGGDSVTANIFEKSPGLWQVSIVNETTGQSYNTTVQYNSSHSSAEWIEERPSLERGGLLPLASFGSTLWRAASALTNGSWVSVGSLNVQPITMLSRSGSILAEPSVLADNAAFSIAETSTSAVPEAIITTRH